MGIILSIVCGEQFATPTTKTFAKVPLFLRPLRASTAPQQHAAAAAWVQANHQQRRLAGEQGRIVLRPITFPVSLSKPILADSSSGRISVTDATDMCTLSRDGVCRRESPLSPP
jgi:hypothetical protein